MFQKEIIPEKMLTYIGENHILLEMITVGVLLLLVIVALVQLSRMKKEIFRICKQVRKYLEVVLSADEKAADDEEIEEELEEEAVDLQEIHTYQKKNEQESSRKTRRREEEILQSQKDAELLMEVIQDVF